MKNFKRIKGKIQKFLDILEDNDDVQNVYHNWEMPEEPDED